MVYVVTTLPHGIREHIQLTYFSTIAAVKWRSRTPTHYNDVIISAMASQITSLTIVYSTVYSGADQRKHQSSASLAFVRGIHRWPVNSPHKGPAARKMFLYDDVIMQKTRFTEQMWNTFHRTKFLISPLWVKCFSYIWPYVTFAYLSQLMVLAIRSLCLIYSSCALTYHTYLWH